MGEIVMHVHRICVEIDANQQHLAAVVANKRYDVIVGAVYVLCC